MLSLTPFMIIYTLMLWSVYYLIAHEIWVNDCHLIKGMWSIGGSIIAGWLSFGVFQTILSSVTDGSDYFTWYMADYHAYHGILNVVGGVIVMILYVVLKIVDYIHLKRGE